MTMTSVSSHRSLASFVRSVETLIEQQIDAAGFEPDQAALCLAGIEAKASHKPLSSHALAPLYLTIRAHGHEVDAGAEPLGAGLMLLYFSLDLFDSVQDDELMGPHAEGGPELAINCAIGLLMLGQELLHDFARALPWSLRSHALQVIRQHCLRSVRGQHRDLTARGREASFADATLTSVEKSALCALRMECAGLFVAAAAQSRASRVDWRFREIGDWIAEIRQIVNDVADLFDGDPSDDLRQGTMSMPLAMFVEQAGDRARAQIERAGEDPAEVVALQRALYHHGVMRRLAARTESVRRRIHRSFSELSCRGPHLALLLAWIDELPSVFYCPPPLHVAVDVDGVDARSMSDADRDLLETLRQRRRERGVLALAAESRAS